MTNTPEELRVGMIRKTRSASQVLNEGVANGELLVTSKVPGLFGNRISLQLVVDNSPGVPVFTNDGQAITFRVSSQRTFEASGPFLYNGSGPKMYGYPSIAAFQTVWFAGKFGDYKSWSLDGLPVTWPLTRDGEFLLRADGAWRLIQRGGGQEIMHWASDSDARDIYQIPSAAKSAEQPYGWYGVAAGCTGYIDAHYGVDVSEAQNFLYLLDGLPEISVVANPYINSLITVALNSGSNGAGLLQTQSRTWLDGGT